MLGENLFPQFRGNFKGRKNVQSCLNN